MGTWKYTQSRGHERMHARPFGVRECGLDSIMPRPAARLIVWLSASFFAFVWIFPDFPFVTVFPLERRGRGKRE